MPKINREDMLELTRRMTLKRNCFGRMAGAYMSPDGLMDDSFNIHFGNLTPADKQKNLEIAKAVPFAETNVELKDYRLEKEDQTKETLRKLLLSINQSELKNDAMLYTLYEYIGEKYPLGKPYAIYLFQGNYDVPLKGKDKVNQWESEEVYSFLVCAICKVNDDYEAGETEAGFLFPAFTDRSSDDRGIAIFQKKDKLMKNFAEAILR